MRKQLLLLISVFILNGLYAQHDKGDLTIEEPTYRNSIYKERKDFNIGASFGASGVYFGIFPSIDIQYKRVTAKVSPGALGIGAGLVFDLKEIPTMKNKWFWVASAYYLYSQEKGTWPGVKIDQVNDTFNAVTILFGTKYYLGKRFYSFLQMGPRIQHNTIISNTPSDELSVRIYLEFALGINFSKSYKDIRGEE